MYIIFGHAKILQVNNGFHFGVYFLKQPLNQYWSSTCTYAHIMKQTQPPKVFCESIADTIRRDEDAITTTTLTTKTTTTDVNCKSCETHKK